ncbi:hypothetical protein PG985_011156 [Apiospora marii]|uniref:Uncharacterized protein n=1 Tax=Apiospora marii TaxID=335849 RepID=A0ABR1SV74_9PEZI
MVHLIQFDAPPGDALSLKDNRQNDISLHERREAGFFRQAALQHDGYVETARAFAEEHHGEKQALKLDPAGLDDPACNLLPKFTWRTVKRVKKSLKTEKHPQLSFDKIMDESSNEDHDSFKRQQGGTFEQIIALQGVPSLPEVRERLQPPTQWGGLGVEEYGAHVQGGPHRGPSCPTGSRRAPPPAHYLPLSRPGPWAAPYMSDPELA